MQLFVDQIHALCPTTQRSYYCGYHLEAYSLRCCSKNDSFAESFEDDSPAAEGSTHNMALGETLQGGYSGGNHVQVRDDTDRHQKNRTKDVTMQKK